MKNILLKSIAVLSYLALLALGSYTFLGGIFFAAKDGPINCLVAVIFPPYAVYKSGEFAYYYFNPPELDLYEEKRLLQVIVNNEFQMVDISEPVKISLITELRSRFSAIDQQNKDQIYDLMHKYCDAASIIYLSPFKSLHEGNNDLKKSFINSINKVRENFTDEAVNDQLDEMLESYMHVNSQALYMAFFQGFNGGEITVENLKEAQLFTFEMTQARKAKALQIIRTILE